VNEPLSEEEMRRLLALEAPRTHARHDDAVLAAARAMTKESAPTPTSRLARRTNRWLVPAALAASFAAGVFVTRFALVQPAVAPPALLIPINDTRGAGERAITVERANADDWYRYILELLEAGEIREAERHLHRFNELHPDYVYSP
jgi:hypothetical protein